MQRNTRPTCVQNGSDGVNNDSGIINKSDTRGGEADAEGERSSSRDKESESAG